MKSVISLALLSACVSAALPYGRDWMNLVTGDNVLVGELPLIPGTSSVVRFYNPDGVPNAGNMFDYRTNANQFQGNVQDILSSGTRYFELYVRLVGAQWTARDSNDAQTSVSLGTIMGAIRTFLANQPSEVVFLSFELETPVRAPELADWLSNNFNDMLYHRPAGAARFMKNLPLADVRGRALIICHERLVTPENNTSINFRPTTHISFARLHGENTEALARTKLVSFIEGRITLGDAQHMRGLKMDYHYAVGSHENHNDAQQTTARLRNSLMAALGTLSHRPSPGVLVMNVNSHVATNAMLRYINQYGAVRTSVLENSGLVRTLIQGAETLDQMAAQLAQANTLHGNLQAALNQANENNLASQVQTPNPLQMPLYAVTLLLIATIFGALMRH